MFISVIVPIFNTEQTLTECVDSVLCDPSADIELVLVDDGSQDSSGRLCDAFAARDSRVVVVHQSNQGLACARNCGIRKARGDYLAHLDSDDFFLEGWFPMLVKAAHSHPEADAFVWHINQLIAGVLIPEHSGFPKTTGECLTGAEAFQTLFCSGQGTFWHSVRYVTKRSRILERQLFYRPGVLHEDVDFNPQMVLSLDRLCLCNQAYYVYRKGREEATTSRFTVNRCQDILGIVARWVSLLPATELDPALQAEFLATLSRLLWDCLPFFQAFPREQRRLLFAGLRPQVHVLRRIRVPARSAAAKRLLLTLLGVRGAVWAIARLRRVRCTEERAHRCKRGTKVVRPKK